MLVIIRVSATTVRAGGSYFLRRLLIKFFPVIVIPSRSDRHHVLLINSDHSGAAINRVLLYDCTF